MVTFSKLLNLCLQQKGNSGSVIYVTYVSILPFCFLNLSPQQCATGLWKKKSCSIISPRLVFENGLQSIVVLYKDDKRLFLSSAGFLQRSLLMDVFPHISEPLLCNIYKTPGSDRARVWKCWELQALCSFSANILFVTVKHCRRTSFHLSFALFSSSDEFFSNLIQANWQKILCFLRLADGLIFKEMLVVCSEESHLFAKRMM